MSESTGLIQATGNRDPRAAAEQLLLIFHELRKWTGHR
jgi:hypothetical protein